MRAHVLVGIAVVLVAGGCTRVKQAMKTTPDRIERPASDYPGQFYLADGGLNSNSSCQQALVDPRDKSTITLIRSKLGYGDYQVSAGKYGVGANELLRVDCTVGRAVGIIRQEE